MLGPQSRSLTANQAWWDGLTLRARRQSGRRTRGDGLALYAMTCGWLSCDLSEMLAGGEGRITFPIPAYLIDHPGGLVLFDTGLHPHSIDDPHTLVGPLATAFDVRSRPGDDIVSRLEGLDVDPGRIRYIVNSHLHFDHTGGNGFVPNARIVVQETEWEAGRIPELIEANYYNPVNYDHGHLVKRVDGEFDLFGDGTVVTIPTFGHTPGHQSLKLRLPGGEIVLAADACYFCRTLENMHLPSLVYDRARMLDSLLLLRKLRRNGARILFGHDPEFWRSIPQAPRTVA